MKFTTPKIVEEEYKGTHLFAAQSFLDRHPEIINHVFVVPDREYEGAHFDKYCEARIDGYVHQEANDKRTEDLR